MKEDEKKRKKRQTRIEVSLAGTADEGDRESGRGNWSCWSH